MPDFENYKYKDLISNLLNDTYYVKISNNGKASGLRRHGEIMVRKILDIGDDKKLTLGEVRRESNKSYINEALDSMDNDLANKFIEIVCKLNHIVRDGCHTQRIENFSNEEIEEAEDAILDLYALMFIKYLLEIELNLFSQPELLRIVSLLPPIIRYKMWSYLFEKDKSNIMVANKLCLSIIKTFDKKRAYEWLKSNENTIRAIPYPSQKEIKYYNLLNVSKIDVLDGKLYNMESKVSLAFEKYNNMYDLLYDKILDGNTSINESGKMYKNFEEAKGYYISESMNIKLNIESYIKIKYYMNEHMDMEHDINKLLKDLAKLFNLMEFVYIGRKIKNTNSYPNECCI